MITKRLALNTLIGAVAIACTAHMPASACSVMMKSNSQGVFIGRTTDFFGPLHSQLEVIPVGITMQDPLTKTEWKVKYGAVGVGLLGIIGEGINEMGLTAHALLQEDAKMPKIEGDSRKVSILSWVGYILTTSGSVHEAVLNMRDYQIQNTSVAYKGSDIPGVYEHIAMFDPTGNAAIIEFNNGKMEIFEGPQYNVLTNAPNLHAQQANLESVKNEKGLYTIGNLPGGAAAKNRFVRATFNMERMPEPENSNQGAIFMEEAVRNIMVPAYPVKINPESGLSDAWETRWHVVYDLNNKYMFFVNDQTGTRVNLDIKKISFKGTKIRYIDPAKGKSDYQL